MGSRATVRSPKLIHAHAKATSFDLVQHGSKKLPRPYSLHPRWPEHMVTIDLASSASLWINLKTAEPQVEYLYSDKQRVKRPPPALPYHYLMRENTLQLWS